jgi:sortase A
MSPIHTTPRPLVILTVFFLAVGLWQIGEGSWIYAKARLAQVLLRRAWSRTLAGERQVTPWPWADTWPVGRLWVPSQNIDLIVLNGSYGRTLAFGPGYSESSAFPGSPGTTILTGHRDTHFRFLRRLKRQDEIVIETVQRRLQRYFVQSSQIVDARTASIDLTESEDQLILVTCYPFDSIVPGGPSRYLVRAIPLPSHATQRKSQEPPSTSAWKGKVQAEMKAGIRRRLGPAFRRAVF